MVPETKMMGTLTPCWRRRLANSLPSMLGILMSAQTSSGSPRPEVKALSASTPSDAARTIIPQLVSTLVTMRRMRGSSSTTMARGMCGTNASRRAPGGART